MTTRSVLLVAAALMAAPVARPAEISMSVLRGLAAVDVLVHPMPPDAEAFGLTAEDIAARARRVLLTSRLRVGPGAANGIPVLSVKVQLAKVRGNSHLYGVEVELRELVRTERELSDLDAIPAATWSRFSIGIANSPESVVNAVAALVQGFAQEHRKENP